MTNDDITKAKKIIADTRGKPDLEEVFIAGALDPASGWAACLAEIEGTRDTIAYFTAENTRLLAMAHGRFAPSLDAGVADVEAHLRDGAKLLARTNDTQLRRELEVGLGHHFAAALSAAAFRAVLLYQDLGILPTDAVRSNIVYEGIRVVVGVFLGNNKIALADPLAAIAKSKALARTLLAVLETEARR